MVNGRTYTVLQQKMLREPPTIQYLRNDPSTNRVDIGAWVPLVRRLFAFVSVFGGSPLLLIGYAQIVAFFGAGKE